MQEAIGKLLKEQGAFSRAVVVPAPHQVDGYHLHLVYLNNRRGSEIIERQRGGYRLYTTIDAAVATARRIGFKRIEVDLTSM